MQLRNSLVINRGSKLSEFSTGKESTSNLVLCDIKTLFRGKAETFHSFGVVLRDTDAGEVVKTEGEGRFGGMGSIHDVRKMGLVVKGEGTQDFRCFCYEGAEAGEAGVGLQGEFIHIAAALEVEGEGEYARVAAEGGRHAEA